MKGYKDFLDIAHPQTGKVDTIINIAHPITKFITNKEPALAYYDLSKSTVYIIVHFWCALCEFEQIYHDTNSPL